MFDKQIKPQKTTALKYEAQSATRKGYTGHEKDSESGLEFAQARYYNSPHGRFTSVDPLTASATIRDPQTFNRYSYALNSPYKFTDPLGLVAKDSGQITQDKGCGKFAGGNCIGYGNDYLPEQQTEGAGPRPNSNTPPSRAEIAHRQPQQSASDPHEKQVDNSELKGIDSRLTKMFTDSGIAIGISSQRNFKGLDNHYQTSDGVFHTIHIYGNLNADTDNAGVFVPKEFSDVKITFKDTVVARNPKTGEVLLIAHVQVTSRKQLLKNMQTVRENGTMYLGKIGGKGGGADKYDGRGIHSHLVYFPSERSRITATEYKSNLGGLSDYTSDVSKHLSDFRKFLK